MSSEDSDRIAQLEFDLVHLQRLYDQLNEVVTEQALTSDGMRRTIIELTKQVKAEKGKSSEESIDIENEKPPHY